MIGVNKVILIGNLGKDPDVVAFNQESRREDGATVVKKASFPLATTEYHKNRDGERVEQTEWHNVVCWRSLAEIAEKILCKGTMVYVEGKLQTRSWEDKEGNKRYITEVVAENFTVIANRNRQDDGQNNWSDRGNANRGVWNERAENASERNGYSDILNASTDPLPGLPF